MGNFRINICAYLGFIGRFLCCREQERTRSLEARIGFAVTEMMAGAVEPMLNLPIGMLFYVYGRCPPGTVVPLRMSQLLGNVLAGYLSEGFGDMLVHVFGPQKPFTEAEERIRPYRVHFMMMVACGPIACFSLGLVCTGHRFGVTPEGKCVSVPHEDIPPSN